MCGLRWDRYTIKQYLYRLGGDMPGCILCALLNRCLQSFPEVPLGVKPAEVEQHIRHGDAPPIEIRKTFGQHEVNHVSILDGGNTQAEQYLEHFLQRLVDDVLRVRRNQKFHHETRR